MKGGAIVYGPLTPCPLPDGERGSWSESLVLGDEILKGLE